MTGHFDRCVLATLLLTVLSGLIGLADTAFAERRAVTGRSYCGFGTQGADSTMEPGGSGDTVIVENPGRIYHFIYDSSSPADLDRHDRIVFRGLRSAELELKRVEDHLIFCDPVRQYELVIERHYCRAAALSGVDIANNEIEQIAFVDDGEIWLTDVLHAEWSKTRHGSFPMREPADTELYGARMQWRVIPFSRVLPDWDKPTWACTQ